MSQHGMGRAQRVSQDNTSLGQAWDFLSTRPATGQRGKTKAICYDSLGRPKDLLSPGNISEIISPARDRGHPIVIVIENIDLRWMVELNARLHIDVAFFREHACNPVGEDLWIATFGTFAGGKRPIIQEPKNTETCKYWHVDGVFEWKPAETAHGKAKVKVKDPNVVGRRHQQIPNSQYGWQEWSTRISYCEITHDNIYIFLVDAPVEGVIHGSSPFVLPTSLHLPVSTSYGGLILPPLLGQSESSLFQCLKQFFSHPWHLEMMKARQLSSRPFLWLLAASTWIYNIRHLNKSISDVAFNDVRRPDLQGPVGHNVHNHLHELRKSLMDLRKDVGYAKKWIHPEVRDALQGIGQVSDGVFETIFSDILNEAETTERFLMDTFQLLMSSISVLDSATSIQQAQSSQKLTQLAFIFIPLNLVTSIFGMNIMEINGSPVRAWVCVVVLVVAITCTISLLMVHDRWNARRSRWNYRALWARLVRRTSGTQ